MHHATTLPQAIARADRLIDEWQQLRDATQDTTPGRLQELAIVQLETDISDTLSAIRYRRQQAHDQAERDAQIKLDDEQRDREEQEQQRQELATKQRLQELTGPPPPEETATH